jgi:hypothetical protein
VATLIFWTCRVVLRYAYALYPLIVTILAARFGAPTSREDGRPSLTVVGTARRLHRDALSFLVEGCADPHIGCATEVAASYVRGGRMITWNLLH